MEMDEKYIKYMYMYFVYIRKNEGIWNKYVTGKLEILL